MSESAEELRKRVAKLRAEAEKAQGELERAAIRETVEAFKRVADERIEAASWLACEGEIDKLGLCSDEWATKCEARDLPSCPRRIVAHEKSLAERFIADRLAMSGVPAALLAIAMHPEPTPATHAVDCALEARQKLLILSGGVGVGKSVAAAYAVRRAPGRWVHSSRYVQAAFQKATDEYDRALMLCVDDLGAEADNEFSRTLISNLICQRWDDGLMTIGTTNLDGSRFKARYDARVQDRIRDSSGWVAIKGGTRRRK